MPSLNTLYGIHLRFGDKTQMKQLQDLQRPRRIYYNTREQIYKWQCPRCLTNNQKRMIFDAIHNIMTPATPRPSQCRNCNLSAVVFRPRNQEEIEDLQDWDQGNNYEIVAIAFAHNPQRIDLRIFRSRLDPGPQPPKLKPWNQKKESKP